MHDPMTLICTFPSYASREWMGKHWWIPRFIAGFEIFRLWHVDPCKGAGGDDTCGWFKRAHHGNKATLELIVKRFDEDWDRTWTYNPDEHPNDEDDGGKRTYCRGLFYPNGIPRMSASAVALNLFMIAANAHFACNGSNNWKASKKFLRQNFMDILLFAENPTDSLFDSFYMTFGKCENREERIRNNAAIIYGWILRADQKWWQHPRWHVRHWKIEIPAYFKLHRWLLGRCCRCGKGFRFNESPVGNWDGSKIWHDRCQNL